ncbi:MAG: nucleoside deaminase [Rickettsiales bacterium]|jgi:tRNA(adenine34) deaminase|nr:nucleoside deaminase [Rickettsiales bacterium]
MNKFMQSAMRCAARAQGHDDVPIGAVIVRDGKIIARGENRVQKNGDPTAHAEIVAIRAATKKLGKKFLDGCDIYVTLEPCAMCATAISLARIANVIFAAADPKGGAILHNARVFDTDPHLWKPAVTHAADTPHADESAKMLRDFFHRLRRK